MIAVVIPTIDPNLKPPIYDGIPVFVVYDGSKPLDDSSDYLLGQV